MRRGQLAASARRPCNSPGFWNASGWASSAPKGCRILEPARHLALSLGERQRTQVAAFDSERIVKDDVARIFPHHLRIGRLAIEPLLQVIEAGDLVTGFHDKLAIEHRVEVHAREHIGKRTGNIVAAAREQRLAVGRGHDLHADAVEFPFRQEGVRRDARQVGVLQWMGEHDRGGTSRHPSSSGFGHAFQPGEKVEIGRLLRVPTSSISPTLTPPNSASTCFTERATLPMRSVLVPSFKSAQRSGAVILSRRSAR